MIWSLLSAGHMDYTAVLTEWEKWSGFCESRNVTTWRFDIMSYSLNDITDVSWRHVCRQHYSMNNRLISHETRCNFILQFKDVASGKDLPDTLERVKFSSMAWTHDNKGILYNVSSSTVSLCLVLLVLLVLKLNLKNMHVLTGCPLLSQRPWNG